MPNSDPDQGLPAQVSTDFSARAEAYKNFRPRYPDALFDFVAEHSPGHGLAWDCGCGSGQGTTALAGHFQSVIATDISFAQLKRAEPHPRVAYLACTAEASALGDHCVDSILVTQAVHWFDFSQFYAEARRVSRTNALLTLAGYGLMRVDRSVDALIDHFYFDVVGRYWPPERRLLDQEYKTLPFPFPEIVAPAIDIRVEWKLADLLGYISTWTAVENYREYRRSDPLPALAAELAAHWGARRIVRWPIYVRAGHIRAAR